MRMMRAEERKKAPVKTAFMLRKQSEGDRDNV